MFFLQHLILIHRQQHFLLQGFREVQGSREFRKSRGLKEFLEIDKDENEDEEQTGQLINEVIVKDPVLLNEIPIQVKVVILNGEEHDP